MNTLLQQAQQAGLSEKEGESVLGGFFSFLKNQLDGGDYSKIQEAVPEADALAERAEGQGTNNMLSSAMGILGGGGGSGGGGGASSLPQLLSQLAALGID